MARKVAGGKVTGKSDRYTYRITWSEEDNEYVGLCAEFPSLSWLADTQAGALQGINDVVSEVISDMASNGEAIPEPLSLRQYSGNFTVRIPPDIHRKLAIQAAENDVSVNRLISAKLAAL
ncbi:MAG TPA: type II toxin-antitoxin system HicB family antitoxin [Dehalococcoidia bacterium]|nr:type II toxin-antitoxin system HicB family antitoxin [Dehalococcoidia bacterium]